MISLEQIKNAFDYLIENKKSREEMSNWAVKLLFAADDGNLEFVPTDEKDKIWNGIKYLTGVDLKIASNTYYYSIEDFINYKNKL
jgi:hypothetical protein